MTKNVIPFPDPPKDQELMACPDCDGVVFITFTDGLGCIGCNTIFDVQEFYSFDIEFEPDDAS